MNSQNKSQIQSVLEEIREMLSVLVKLQLGSRLQDELVDSTFAVIYDLTGQKTVKEISQLTGVSTGQISALWQKWEAMGLLVKDGARYKKIF